MYGVMMPGASAGSNHVGARETWTPHVSWPSAAAAGVTADPTSIRTSTARHGRREYLMAPPRGREVVRTLWSRLQPRGQSRGRGWWWRSAAILEGWREDEVPARGGARQLVVATTTCPREHWPLSRRDFRMAATSLLVLGRRRYHRRRRP